MQRKVDQRAVSAAKKEFEADLDTYMKEWEKALRENVAPPDQEGTRVNPKSRTQRAAERRSSAGRHNSKKADPDRELTIDELIIDDGEPVDNIFVERQQRLLVDPLHASWRGPGKGRTFLALCNVGLFPEKKQTPLVPDAMLSLDVPAGLDPTHRKEHNSYFLWIMGKPPDVVVEIVSDRRGGEAGHKLTRYAQIGVPYYVIYDPAERLRAGELRAFELRGGEYRPLATPFFSAVKLGLTFWEGAYEALTGRWLRWTDARGRVIQAGEELARAAVGRLEKAKRRVDDAKRQADDAKRQADDAKRQADDAKRQAEDAKRQADDSKRQADDAKRQTDDAKRQAERERNKRQRLEARLRALGVEPPNDE
jgi:Uma2 family endonuclease